MITIKNCEIGWIVGRPGAVTTDSYFHAKYVPEGRGGGSGQGENLGQNIFHRPASSGQYAVVVNLDYQTRKSVRLRGPAKLKLFDPSTSQWSSVLHKTIELQLPPGGGVLVAVGRGPGSTR